MESTGAKVIWLPPYSPDLNPIELKFNLYKADMRRNCNAHWINAHLHGLEAVTPQHARACYRRCLNKLGVEHPLVKEKAPGLVDDVEESNIDSNIDSNFFTIACLFSPIPILLAFE
jgi:hypothetical protein